MTLATHEDDLLGLVDHQHHPADDPAVLGGALAVALQLGGQKVPEMPS